MDSTYWSETKEEGEERGEVLGIISRFLSGACGWMSVSFNWDGEYLKEGLGREQ